MINQMTKKMVIAGMVIMAGFSGIVAAALFEDDFESNDPTNIVIDSSKWDVATHTAGGNTYVKDNGTYVRIYTYKPDTSNYAHMTTKDSFSIGSGLNVNTVILFVKTGPGAGDWYDRPYIILQDADGNNQLIVYSPFTYGDNSAQLKVMSRQSGTFALRKTTVNVATSTYLTFDMDVTTTSTAFKLYNSVGTKVDEWVTAYDSISGLKVRYGVGCNGYWPTSSMYIDQLTINPILSGTLIIVK